MLGRKGKRLAAVAAFAVAGSTLLALPAAHATATPIVIWTDVNRQPAIIKMLQQTIGTSMIYKGHQVQVVIDSDVKGHIATVTADNAPDIFVGTNDWIGGLVSNGLIEKLYPSAATLKSFIPATVSAMKYHTGLWAIPYDLENEAFIVNNKLVPKNPTTWAQVEKTGLALKKAKKVTVPLSLDTTNAYDMYAIMSGLGGYVFGKNGIGDYDPYTVGVASKTFIKNAPLIDKWVKEGLISASVSSVSQKTFTDGKSPFWLTGPWQMDKDAKGHSTLNQLKFKYSIIPVPTIVKGIQPVPFSGSWGYFVSKYATTHAVDLDAKSLVNTVFAGTTAQAAMARYGGRFPASIAAGKGITNKDEIAFNKAAGTHPYMMPNIPAMGLFWQYVPTAWSTATAVKKPVPAATAFKKAYSQIITNEN